MVHAVINRIVRSSTSAPDVESVESRSGQIAAAVRHFSASDGHVTLATIRTESGLESYVTAPSAGYIYGAVASAVGGKATPVADTPDIDTPAIGWLSARPTPSPSRATQHGGDQSEMAMLLGRVLQVGEWVAVTMRQPTKSEIRNARRWYDHRLRTPVTHYSKDANAVCASIFAGAGSDAQVANILSQVASAIPGFDVETRVVSRPLRVRFVVAMVLAAAAAIGVLAAPHSFLHRYTQHLSHTLMAAIAAGVVLAAWTVFTLIPTADRRTKKLLDHATTIEHLPAPLKRQVPPRKPVRKDVVAKDNDGQPRSRHIERPGDYPLASVTYFLRPAMVVGIVSPHAGAEAGLTETRSRTVPQPLAVNAGPIVGHGFTSTNLPVRIDPSELYGGVFIAGIPGSGKTVLVNHLWAWNSAERVRPSGRPGCPGQHNALIAFESKGEGSGSYRHWSDALGDRVTEVSLANPATPAIDLGEPSLPAADRARIIVSAMTAAFKQGAIQDSSSKALTAAIALGLLCPPEVSIACAAGRPMSFMRAAHILLTGEGDARGVELHAKICDAANAMGSGDPRRLELADALARMDYIYGPSIREAARRSVVTAPENKLDLLMQVPHWWDPTRPHAPWSQVLRNHAAVIVNSGVDSTGNQLDPAVANIITSMLAYALKDSIQRVCSGWWESGQSVTICADELAILAASTGEVIEWLRDAGRSYGVRLVLATQRPEQITIRLRSALKNSAHTIWFRQSDPGVVQEIVALLSMDGSSWTANDLLGLDQFQAIVRSTSTGRMQSPLPVTTPWWGTRPTPTAAFLADHGYPSRRPVNP